MSQEEKTKNKCVIFAQHTTALNAVEEHLLAPHLPTVRHLRLDGGVAAKDRYSIAKAFEEDDGVEVLLCTTKVGGLGLNLVSANICIFLEMDYNPMSDLQAMDRLHRIGQSRAVSVYRLVTRGTVEEMILKMQGVKVRVGDEIVSQENSSMWSLGTDRCERVYRTSTTNILLIFCDSATNSNVLNALLASLIAGCSILSRQSPAVKTQKSGMRTRTTQGEGWGESSAAEVSWVGSSTTKRCPRGRSSWPWTRSGQAKRAGTGRRARANVCLPWSSSLRSLSQNSPRRPSRQTRQ